MLPLRRLLKLADRNADFQAFLNAGGEAFISRSLQPFLLAALLDAKQKQQPTLVVTCDDESARLLAADLEGWLSPRPVGFYPSRGVTYESHLVPSPHLVGLRIAALDGLTAGDQTAPVMVASAAALSERVPDQSLRPRGFKINQGETVALEQLAVRLVAAGYERVTQVEERGQFAVRGGLLDLYPATAEQAVRVDLFGDEVESLRWFSTFTQRSLGTTDEVAVEPAAELDPDYRELYSSDRARAGKEALVVQPDRAGSEAQPLQPPVEDEHQDIADLLPIDDFRALLDIVGADTEIVVVANEELEVTLRDHWQDVTAAFHDQAAHQLYQPPDTLLAALAARARYRFSSLSADQPHQFLAQVADTTARNLDQVEAELEKLQRSAYSTVVTWAHRGEGERVQYNMSRVRAVWPDQAAGDTAPVSFIEARLREGFVAPSFKLAVLPDHRLFRRRTPREPAPARGRLRSFADLRTGDFVVHEDHGIARFAGFETKSVAGVTRDYLYLEYDGADKVYVPVDQLAKISRYIGAGGGAPKLSKLGGTRWEQMKARAQRAASELAGELLNLYAERKRQQGHPFPADSDWQRQFEAAFPYIETADQLAAIDDVKRDMESGRPMDRLVCGDVGYGKTEVALRAAYKAVDGGKQVLLLVPTTILAQQHYGTFAERLQDYPINVDYVSRFRSSEAQRAAIAGFAAGKVDVLVGTHRLLSSDIRPKDLGLLIVDEEQRFGVKQKELLRQLKLRVDVIAMSATPIPRTMQMSLAGVRDLSVIETAPAGRRPVKTYVGEYDEGLVKQALEREIERGGQAFFLHNRVETIDETAVRISALCPTAKVIVVHGQLDEKVLEQRMVTFLRGEANILVATSIIESGIDIPEANTLIIERADTFGLAQLYQLRGRVGRSRERAYAYLFYPSAATLTEAASHRLTALSDFTELGAGVKIAMRDLEIRGAGSLLGEEQSGHLAALGFELYMQMLDDAVRSMGDESEAAEEYEPVRLDINVDAFVPAAYIPYEQAKVDVHRRIAAAREVADLVVLQEELADRFGPPPPELANLIDLQRARIKFGRAGIKTVVFRGDRLAVTPVELDSVAAKELRKEIPSVVYEPGREQISLRVSKDPKSRFPAVIDLADALLRAVGTMSERVR